MPGQDKLHLPLDQGLDFSKASTERPWETLTNVYRRYGYLRVRPALVPVTPANMDPMRSGQCVSIGDISATDEDIRGEVTLPTADVYTVGWTIVGAGTASAALDDSVTDDSAFVTFSASASPDYLELTFGAPAISYLAIDGILIRLLALSSTAVSPHIRFNGLTSVGQITVPASSALTWYELFVPRNPDTNLAWTIANLTGASWALDNVPNDFVFFKLASWSIEVVGRVSAAPSAGTAKGRVVVTSRNFMRLEGNQQAWTNIQGTAAAPTSNALEKWDRAAILNRLYYVNGRDPTYFYPRSPSDLFMGQMPSGTPIGRSCMAFGERLVLLDVTENTVRDEQRLRWSAHVLFGGPENWTDATSGNLELWGGQGRGVRCLPLSAQLAVCYREQGIFNVSWTGRDDVPFIPQLMTPFVGCSAKATVRAATNNRGALVHYFLGRGPEGLNVYEYNGATARPIGYQIQRPLRRDSNPAVLRFSFAVMDPKRNLYLLFIAETGELNPDHCWVFVVETEQWYRWELPFKVHNADTLNLEECDITFP